jgi:hypothetical protein
VSEHLSSLQVDEIAAGLSPVPEHVVQCAACAQQLEAIKAQNAAFLARPQAKAQVARLSEPPRRSFLRIAAVAVPLAAGIALFFAMPADRPVERIKGAASVVLLDASGQPVTRAVPGQKLTLAVGSGGAARAKVSAVDAQGKTEVLFDGPIAAGARVPLMELEVTPGDVTVTAEFEGGETASVRLAVP